LDCEQPYPRLNPVNFRRGSTALADKNRFSVFCGVNAYFVSLRRRKRLPAHLPFSIVDIGSRCGFQFALAVAVDSEQR